MKAGPARVPLTIEPARVDRGYRSRHKEKVNKKERGSAGTMANPLKIACLAFSNNWRRGFALADILRTGGDAQKSEHSNHW
jgi:hypothetical protein